MDTTYTVKLLGDSENTDSGWANLNVMSGRVIFDLRDPDRRITISLEDLEQIVKRETLE